ncbi:MAG TPA: PilZ domain-containing protein [Anaerolineales bacterium]|nr:PilZ domain-containing protein [Anaerolineales bacterium]
MPDKRKIDRRDFAYYMQVKDEATKQTIGYLSDISSGGFKLDCKNEIPPGRDFRMHLDLTSDIADKNSMIFIARSKWVKRDFIDPNTFNVGFEIVNIAPGDTQIFQRMFEKYGSQGANRNKRSNDYLWR